ncbi:MAG: electron transport complex subunit RsxC [Spirochaetia bacterium]
MIDTKTFPKGGVHPDDKKDATENLSIKNAVIPSEFIIPMQQHIGKPAERVVEAGDEIREGMVLGRAQGFVSASIHSPIPGTVDRIQTIHLPTGIQSEAVVITMAGEFDRLGKRNKKRDWRQFSKKDILSMLPKYGIVGLGGATFPTHVKFSIPPEKNVENFILNAVECEPYLTADDRLMIERAKDICEGLKIVLSIIEPENVYVGIEENTPDAISLMRKTLNEMDITAKVIPLKLKYPQGDEKQLYKAITGKEIPSGKLPLDIGGVISNVGTIYAIYEAIVFDKPLLERVVTVSGGAVKEPANLKAKIGTPIRQLIAECGGFVEEPYELVVGGPMMGFSIFDLDTPVTKGTSGILALTKGEVKPAATTACLQCGNCVRSCPMGLNPTRLYKLIDHKEFDTSINEGLMDCRECGCCSYICPAHIPLVQGMRLGKRMYRKKG